jgi:hypothetical protein
MHPSVHRPPNPFAATKAGLLHLPLSNLKNTQHNCQIPRRETPNLSLVSIFVSLHIVHIPVYILLCILYMYLTDLGRDLGLQYPVSYFTETHAYVKEHTQQGDTPGAQRAQCER